jgi:anti-anti-sigma factor
VELKTQETPDGVKIITLAGRMDIAGTQQIDLRFTSLAASQKAFIAVDLSEVSFLASIGMRTLVSSARALMNRGGAMALASPQPLVNQALVAAGIDSLIPIYPNIGEASRALQASAQKA